MRIVVALGGNALLRRGERPSAETQRRNLRTATRVLARLSREHSLVVTHGNGPQVGLLALQSEAGTDEPLPLDILGAQSQGMIGYMIEDELRDELAGTGSAADEVGAEGEVATLLTQVVVRADDPAFDAPSKPIGPIYSRETATRLAADRGWTVGPDGEHWRRLVPSPEPLRILEIRSVRLLLEAGVVVVCAGGGGVPVVEDEAGGWRGVEAVVDKDLSAALIAHQLDADVLMLLTDVDAVYRDWGSERASPIPSARPEELRELAFAPGSMGPKVDAACRFIEGGDDRPGKTPRASFIGALGDAWSMLEGKAGTKVGR